MVDLPSVLIANAIGVALMIILLISNRLNARNVFFDEKIFELMALLTMLLCICEAGGFVLDGRMFPGARLLSVFLNTILFVVDIFFAFIWTVYVDYKLFEDFSRIRKIYPFVAIPALIIIFMSASNFITGIFFTVNEANVYQRSDWVFLPYLVTYGYLIYGMALVYICRRKLKKYIFLPAIIFLIPVFIGSFLQLCFYGLSLIWPSVAVGVVSLYINIQNEASWVDSLTGLYNRQYLDRYLTYQIQKTWNKKMLAGILMDADSFKEINDTLGHSMGDDALRSIGQILRLTIQGKGFVARYAGDEFIVIRSISDPQEMVDLMDAIHRGTEQFNAAGTKPYKVSLSMGFSVFRAEGDSVDDFLRRMDEGMYQEKRRKNLAR